MAVLTVEGVLDAGNSAPLRDSITKATLDKPSAVIVDISALRVPEESTLSAFIGARWQLETEPDVPYRVGLHPSRDPRGGHPQRGRALHAGVFDRESGD